jgi:hypothetical protein
MKLQGIGESGEKGGGGGKGTKAKGVDLSLVNLDETAQSEYHARQSLGSARREQKT